MGSWGTIICFLLAGSQLWTYLALGHSPLAMASFFICCTMGIICLVAQVRR